jgi:hypothetical protein
MKSNQSSPRLSIAGKLPEGYVILCRSGGDEYSFLVKILGISVECPHCGATRHGVELAQEHFLGGGPGTSGPIGVITRSHHVPIRSQPVDSAA